MYLSANDSSSDLVTLKHVVGIQTLALKLVEEVKIEQMRNLALVLDMMIFESENASHVLCYEVVEPVFFSLLKKVIWDEIDIQIASRISAHSINFKEGQKLLSKIDKEGKDAYRVTAKLNFLFRLIRILYTERHTNPMEKGTTVEEISEEFKIHLKDLNNLCDKYNYTIFKTVTLVREGIFFGEQEKINEGLTKLRELDRNDMATTLIKEIKDLYSLIPEEVQYV